MAGVVVRRFEDPDERREFENGSFELIGLPGVTIGRARYEPGWKWSTHVGPTAGTPLCQVEHVGMVLSGRAAIAMADGETIESAPVTCSTSCRDTTAGSSATSRTSRCTSSAPRPTPPLAPTSRHVDAPTAGSRMPAVVALAIQGPGDDPGATAEPELGLDVVDMGLDGSS
jgi:hypothetical protein